MDYKICSPSIAQRIKKVLNEIIGETQTGFMKGRYIGECMRLICDLIDKCNEPEILILLDFEKAFDSIEWPFICKLLQFFGFGKSIIQGLNFCIKTLKAMCKIMGICLSVLR